MKKALRDSQYLSAWGTNAAASLSARLIVSGAQRMLKMSTASSA